MKKISTLVCSSIAILALGLSISLPSSFAQNVENATNQSIQTISEDTVHSETASSGSATLKVSWDEPKLGSPTTFHVEATGGSDKYMFRMDAPWMSMLSKALPIQAAANGRNTPQKPPAMTMNLR